MREDDSDRRLNCLFLLRLAPAFAQAHEFPLRCEVAAERARGQAKGDSFIDGDLATFSVLRHLHLLGEDRIET